MSLAPPAAKGGFSYAGDSIYVEASGHNRHRRATIPELKAHFKGTSDVKDPPAHWYEAQLLHYGLPPSKTKGTAKMRLFEAVNKGNMTVPSHIQKLEADLKKEWTKNEREVKKALKQQAAPSLAAKSTKRKADAVVASATNINLNLSLSVNSSGAIQIQTAEQPKKKAKTTGSAAVEKTPKATKSSAATAKKAPTPKAKEPKKTAASTTSKKETQTASATSKATKSAKPKDSTPKTAVSTSKSHSTDKFDTKAPRKPQTAKRGGAMAGSRTNNSISTAATSSKASAPRTKQTARRGGSAASGLTNGSRSAGPHSSPPVSRAPVKKQTARRGGFQTGGRTIEHRDAFGATGDSYDEPPPPYTELPDDDHAEASYYRTQEDGYDDDYSDSDRDMMDVEEDVGGDDDEEPLAPLGLLNGRYMIECSSLTAQQEPGEADAGLILTLDGDSLWGSFDFGGINGILYLPTRPWQSSHDGMPFMWRGEDHEGNTFRGDEHPGHIWFLGRGRIRGELLSDCSGWHDFDGDRISGQETRSEISAWSMRRQWDERE